MVIDLKLGKTRCRIDDIQTSMYIIVSHYFFLSYLIILEMARFPNDKKIKFILSHKSVEALFALPN